ncbi:YraN family protein [Candidatus Roizmanbacteria bacterium]|nr:MAG: YraN family protein [Candidatus Roizmanbacteria bacterium]
MSYDNKKTGSYGESIAIAFLKSKGYAIYAKNSTSRWGEIDIIAEKNNVIHFVEVKTRKSTKQGLPVEAVTYHKITKLLRTVQFYIHSNALYNKKFQIDVIGIRLSEDNTMLEMKYYPNLSTDLFL